MRKIIVSCIYCSVAVIAACTAGSGSGGSPGAITTSVNTSLPVNQLTTSQLQQWCNDVEAFAAANKAADQNISCLSEGLQAGRQHPGSGAQSACSAAYQACESGGDAGTGGVTVTTSGQDCSTVSTTEFANCTSTVGAFDQCLQDTYAAEESVTVDSVCSTLGSTTDSNPLDLPTPASCTTVEQCVTSSSSVSTTTTTGNGG